MASVKGEWRKNFPTLHNCHFYSQILKWACVVFVYPSSSPNYSHKRNPKYFSGMMSPFFFFVLEFWIKFQIQDLGWNRWLRLNQFIYRVFLATETLRKKQATHADAFRGNLWAYEAAAKMESSVSFPGFKSVEIPAWYCCRPPQRQTLPRFEAN